MEETGKKRTYTVSDKVPAARGALGKKRRGTGKDWVTCKVARNNVMWARHTHGSVNAALESVFLLDGRHGAYRAGRAARVRITFTGESKRDCKPFAEE